MWREQGTDKAETEGGKVTNKEDENILETASKDVEEDTGKGGESSTTAKDCDLDNVNETVKEISNDPANQDKQTDPIQQQQTRRCARFVGQNIKIAEKAEELTRKRNLEGT